MTSRKRNKNCPSTEKLNQTADRTLRLRVELPTLLAIAMPLAAAYVAELAMMFTDMVIAGRLGSLELAAVGLAGNLLNDFLFSCMNVVSIVGVFVAQACGTGDRDAVRCWVRQGLWVATALSLPGMLFCWYLAPLLSLTGQDEQVILLASEYLHALVWCFLPTMWFTVLSNFVTALSRARSIMVITVAAVGLNVIANYTLVFGKFGFPALGVAGAGYGTSIVSWSMFGAIALHILQSRFFRSYRVFSRLGELKLPLCWEILRIGLPVAGLTIVENGMFSVVAVLMGVLGASLIAANQIVINFADIAIVVSFAIGEAASIRVAHWIGAGSLSKARQVGYIAVTLGALVMALMAIILWTMPEAIVSIYLDIDDPANAKVLALAVSLFGIAAIFQIFDGVQAITGRALRGFKDTVVPLWIATVGNWIIGVTGGYILAFPLGMGGLGLWWGLVLGLTVTSILLLWRFYTSTMNLSQR